MSLTLVAVTTAVLGFVAIIGGLVIVDRAKGETTRKTTTGTTKKLKKTITPLSARIEGEVFHGKTVAVRRKGSISAEETGRLRAQGELRLPRAVAAIVFGFSVLLLSLGILILTVAGVRVGSVLLAALFFVYGVFLPIGWFKKERSAMASVSE